MNTGDEWQTYRDFDIQTIDERPGANLWTCYASKRGNPDIKCQVSKTLRKDAIQTIKFKIDNIIHALNLTYEYKP